MLQMLLHYGGDVNHPAGFHRGGTCLQLAAGAGHIGLVRLLLDKGATVNAQRSLISGRTAIEIAAEAGRLDVLKLLLLQKEHLFQTAAERYQFIRAAKFADLGGRKTIVAMLRQHINWQSNDQRLFDDIERISPYFDCICLDEMTQAPLDDEKQDPDFWECLCDISSEFDFEHVYDIVGIEQWIGERREEVFNDRTTSGLDCNPEEDDLPLFHAIPTDQRSKTAHEVKLAGGKPRSQTDRQPDLDQRGEPMLSYVSHDTLIDLADLPSNLMCEQSAVEWPAWGFGSESREQSQALAPQAVRQGGNMPEWLDMEDYGIDGMTQEAAYDLAAQNTTWDALEYRDTVQDVSWTPGTVLGEVLEEAPTIYDEGDVVVDHSKDGEVGAAEDSHVQGFDWGFWDDESFAIQSGKLEYSGC
ncbi:hypothetical protein Daus18300_010802 [Diaporthe australafricana]|uniref:Ankyrin repeat protein n=1 Tax=Diaporthe australafricana TaxID=127596 RepID=A0ABR3W925_9PEZI